MDSEAFDDLIQQWHSGAGQGQELHEFLGFTWAEYVAFTSPGATEVQP